MAGLSSNEATEERRRRILLITYPRTASNLLVKMLSLDSQTAVVSNEKGGYFFWNAFMTGRATGLTYKPIEHWNVEETDQIQREFQKGVNELEDKHEIAKSAGKITFAKEHAQWFANPAEVAKHLSGQGGPASLPFSIEVPYISSSNGAFSSNNLTILPDEYLHTWTPTFLIRHPALAFPSFYRSMLDLENEGFAGPHERQPMLKLFSTLKWTRLLYDWYRQHGSDSSTKSGDNIHLPLLLDAQDVTNEPAVVARYCELIGMDPTKLKFEWNREALGKAAHPDGAAQKTPEEVMMATLNHSSTLLKEKTPVAIDMVAEAEKWKNEFGEDIGKQMEEWVQSAMPDYDYLRARRLHL
ncbi:hypothetical protein PENANT_c012G11545 [Penicillium antarcticum]|uniref:Sulfotransferase domain-containing protein n=1 Tax=Penicillium antarcticum TaxID=416450 RepID=A0A1V6Q5W2_9EURO|nr:uncharacterized protein N7508_008036 [Penicillium antarcticum]KAJ5297787.1 hypothetical protein N7508_008036 [Penicillium antarcticum]OQD84630.1 hypothetical protein PENANT_c012G11545 [Penicillium antarcticum]